MSEIEDLKKELQALKGQVKPPGHVRHQLGNPSTSPKA